MIINDILLIYGGDKNLYIKLAYAHFIHLMWNVTDSEGKWFSVSKLI